MADVKCVLLLLLFLQSNHGEEMHFEFPPEKLEDSNPGEVKEHELTGSEGNANNYLDAVLKNVRRLIEEKADPLQIQDYQKGFKKKVGPINFTGYFQASNVVLNGLSTLHRAGESSLSSTTNLNLHLETVLGINNLGLKCNAEVSLSKLRIPFDLLLATKYVRAKMEVEANLNDPSSKPRVTRFEILEIGKITVDVKRLGPLNFVLKGLGFVFLNMLRSVLKTKLAPPLMKILNDALQSKDIASYLG